MEDNLYAFIAIIGVIIYCLIIRCNASINKNEKNTRAFTRPLYALMAFGVIDAVWGLCDTKTIDAGRGFFWAVSYLFHLGATVSAYVWFLFSKRYLKYGKNVILLVFETLPLIVAGTLLIMQFDNGCIFWLSPIGVYHTGDCRSALFGIQFFYFVYGFVRTVISLLADRESSKRLNHYISIEFMLVLTLSGIFQMIFPNAPYYSAGFMLAAIIVFNGSIVIERQKISSEAISEQKQSIDEMKLQELEYERALARAYEDKNVIYAEILKMLNTGVIATDSDGRLTLANDMALEMFGHSGVDRETLDYSEFVSSAEYIDFEEAEKANDNLLNNNEPITYYMRANIDGTDRYYKADAKKLILLDRSETIITCFMDVTESKNHENALRVLSQTDELTQIDNRRSGESKIAIKLHENPNGMFCLIDINKFKNINDRFGHQIGDEALVETARALKESFRGDDVTMRMGGDEFAVFAGDITNAEQAAKKITSLFEKIDKINIEKMNGEDVSISLGAVFADSENLNNFDAIYRQADKEMYKCKGEPGNNCSIMSKRDKKCYESVTQ